MSARRRALPAAAFDVRGAFAFLQQLITHVDTMTYAAERHFERFSWRCTTAVDDTEDPIGHLAHLIGAAREASLSAKSAARVIATELAKRGGGA